MSQVWPHDQFPLIEVGMMTLNRNSENYFSEVEQVAFSPAHVVPGIGYSPDKNLQVSKKARYFVNAQKGRLLAYLDSHHYRLGKNVETIPVNAPKAPVRTYTQVYLCSKSF